MTGRPARHRRRATPARLLRPLLAAVVVVVMTASAAWAQSSRWPSSSPPRPLPERAVTFPPYEVRSLANGLSVVVVVHNEQPAISLRLIVRAGGAQDPPDKLGLAGMTAWLLDQGTTTRTAQQVADTIDSAGGDLETGAARDMSFANVTVMKDGLGLGMDLMADVVRRPAFAPEEMERYRQQLLAALRVSYEDPRFLADLLCDRLVYGSHPYGLPSDGTPATIEKLTRADLVEFHRRHYAPNNSILAIVGDVTVEQAMAEANRAFGDWPRRELPADVIDAPPKAARRLVVLDKPDAVQTEIRVGQLGIPRNNKDYMAFRVAMNILGGEGANRLHRVLRVERGLTYGASVQLETLARSGEIVAETNTRTETTGEALRLIVDEFARLRRERVGDTELEFAKAYLAGSFPLTIETPNDIALQVLNVLFYGLPVEDLQTFQKRVDAVTADYIEYVAGKYLQPDKLSVVLVGNAAGFLDQLGRVGFNHVDVVPASDLDVSAPDLRRVAVEGAKSDPAAAALIDLAVKAKGGAQRLRAVRTLTATAKTTFNRPDQAATAETRTYIQYPDRFRVEARVPAGVVVRVLTNGGAWVTDPVKGVAEAAADERRELSESAQRDVLSLLVRALAGGLQMKLVEAGGGADGGQSARAVELTAPGMSPVTLFVDPRSGMVVKEAYELSSGGGPAEEAFSDYRDVDGVKFAFRATVRRGNEQVLTRVVTDLHVNAPVDPSLFAMPAKLPQP